MSNRIVGNCLANMSSQIRSVTEVLPPYLRDQTDVLVALTHPHLETCKKDFHDAHTVCSELSYIIESLMYLMSRCFPSLLNSHWDSPAKRP